MNDHLSPTQLHLRRFEQMKYVYPVLSRRSGGISIGINLNPDRACPFACVYCQVLADSEPLGPGDMATGSAAIDLNRLERELRQVLAVVQDGTLFRENPRFHGIDERLRRLNDLAFSGDGEPTISPRFGEAVERVAAVRRELCPAEVKLVLITNATRLRQPKVLAGLERLMQENGEVWAKLDAGTESFYRQVSRSQVPFSTVLTGIIETSREFPIVIQTCFFAMAGQPPPDEEITAYIDRLREIHAGNGHLARIQLYTVARRTPDPQVTPLEDETLNRIADQVRANTQLPVEVFYSR